ncbi:glycosyltransferase [Sphingomonas sp.]|uniref:glycosyltransferase n=1 Tax=Sphingomonas sp. TaxID=28214 RepID=UPI0025F834CB|nr:glycosyltransferase [Sphingomonas sp.]
MRYEARVSGAPPPPLKVLTFLNSFHPGGVERVALRMNAQWRAMGISAPVYIGRDEGSARDAAAGADVRIIPGDPSAARAQGIRWMVRHLPGIVRAEAPDILFCAGNTYTAVAAAVKLALGRACPPVLVKISNDLERRDMGPLLRLGYHRWVALQGQLLDHFIAMAPAMVPEMEARLGVPAARISVVNDPVLRAEELAALATLRQRAPHHAGGRRFLAIGRLAPQKNFPLLLEAFAKMAAAEDRLKLLGDGPERDMLQARAAALGIADRLSMPGHVGDLKPWLADADIFVMSSDYEGVPAVVIEAIAAQLAMVVTDCSVSMRDLLGQGRFGALVPVRDAAALAAAMGAAPRGQPDPAAATDHARQFTLEAGADAYLAVMRQLVAARAARAR